MKCPRCGTDNIGGRMTCYLCHTPLQSNATPNAPTTEGMAAQTRPQMSVPFGNYGSSGSVSTSGGLAHSATQESTAAEIQASWNSTSNSSLPAGPESAPSAYEGNNGYSHRNGSHQGGYHMDPIPVTPSSQSLPTRQGMLPPSHLANSLDSEETVDQQGTRKTSPSQQSLEAAWEEEMTTQRTPPPNAKTDPHPSSPFAQHQSHSSDGYSTNLSYPDTQATPQPNFNTPVANQSSFAPTEEMTFPAPSSAPNLDQTAPSPIFRGQEEPTSPSQPGLYAASSAPMEPAMSSPQGGTSARRSLAKPKLEKDFVFAPKVELPSLSRRLFAGALDLALVCTLALLVAFLFGPKLSHPFPQGLHGIDLLATVLQRYTPQFNFAAIAFVVIFFVYATTMHSIRGQTIGKMLFGLRVIDRSGNPCSILGALARSLAFILFFFLGMIGLSWILFDKEYRSLHDRLSGSLVIRIPPAQG